MIIVNFGHFKLVSSSGIMFFQNEHDQDWYEIRKSLTTWEESTGKMLTAVFGAWATVDPETNLVTHVESDPSLLVPNDRIVLGIDADAKDISPRMVWDGETLSDAPLPEPKFYMPITKKQLKIALLRKGIKSSDIDDAINSLPEGQEKEEALIEWLDGTSYKETDPLISIIREKLNISDDLFGEIWEEAETI